MFKRFRHMILLAILLSGTLQVLAQIALPDTVCTGTTRTYGVKGLAGSVYTWWIDGVSQSSTTDSFEKYWDSAGLYKLEVQEYQASCSGERVQGMVTVINIPKLDIQLSVEACLSYTLPKITGTNLSGNEAYYDNSQALGGKKITGAITSTQKVWIYDFTSINPNCSDETNFDVVIIIPPESFAGNSGTICPGNAYVLIGSTASHYSGLQWSSTGDGKFDDSTLLSPTYTPGPADLQTGSVTLTLTATGWGNGSTCAAAVSMVTLTISNFTAVVDSTDVTCYGAKNGTILISSPSGGSGNYEYNIGTGWTTLTSYLNLAPGNYPVQMRDALLPVCVITLGNIQIKEPEPLSALTEHIDASCMGNDGTISVIEPKGGSGGYEYALNGTDWTTSGYFTNLIPGTYVVWINDANVPDCKVIAATIVINKPEPLTAKVSSTKVSCFGGNDGTITISEPQNGSASYQFSIDGSDWVSGMVFGNLKAGSYTVQMREQNATSCVQTIAEIIITEPEQLQAAATSTSVSCHGSKDGSISILSPKGGSGSYQFTVDGTSWSNSLNFNNLGPNTYTVLMQDLNVPGCRVPVDTIIITEPAQLTAAYTSTDITCYGASDGVITISDPKNGLAPYQYSIDGSNWKVSGSFAGLGPNVYIVQMLDSKGCKDTVVTIQINEPLPLTADVAWTNATCLGNDGTISITNPINSQSGLYEYNIDGTNWINNGVITGLAANTYIVRIRDTKLTTCERTIKTVAIDSPIPLQATAKKTDVTCYNANDGTITVTSSTGGSGLYEYTVDGTSWISQSSFTGLSPVNYTLQMRDANARTCTFTVGTYPIDQPDQLKATIQAVDVSCFDGKDGSILITGPKGGSGSFEYSVNGVDWVSGNPGGLIAGTYSVQMRDAAARECIVSLGSVEIKQPKQLMATINSVDVTCFGGNDGSITITSPINGKEPYQYSLDGGITWQTDGTFAGLNANTYNLVIIQDANNCKAPLTAVVISEPTKLEALASGTNETRPGANDGTITISAQMGGSGVYEYSIDGVTWQLASVFTGLAPATDTVHIRDAIAVGCLISLPVNILPAGSLTATFTSHDVTCYGGNDGSIAFANASGTTNYQYSITGGSVWQTNEYFSDLTAQSYTLMVRDFDLPANSTIVGTIELKQPATIEAKVTVTNETFAGANDGTISVNSITGGSGGYEYSIDGISWVPGGVFTGQSSGTYDVQIRDKNAPGCLISVQKVIQPSGSLSADVSQTSVGCYGSQTGTITISKALGGSGTFEYSIDNGVTWQLSGNYTGLAAGTYDVMLRDAQTPANKISLGKVNITQPQKLIATYNNYVPPLCAGGSGSITISAMGGIPPYTGTGTFPIPSGVGDVYKTYTVSDNNGCIAKMTFMISNPEKIVATDVVTPPLCYGAEGTVTVSAIGGTGTLLGTGTFKVQAGKSYNFKVTDSNGCQSNIISGQMPQGSVKIDVTVTTFSSLCSGGNATVTVSASGGLAPYTGIGNFDVSGGIHSFTVTDANGCSSVGSIDVTQKEPPLAPTVGVTVMPTCDKPTGSILLSGLPSGAWTINPGSKAGTGDTLTISGLIAGRYNFTVTDANGCTSPASADVVINAQPLTPVLTIGSWTNPLSCGDKGSIVLKLINVPNGTYTISSDEFIFFNVIVTSGVATIPAKTNTYHNLQITVNNCTSVTGIDVTLTDPTEPSAPITGTPTQPDCDTLFGSVKLSGLPSTGNWTINPGGETGTGASTIISNLTPGTSYSFTVTNAVGCTSVPSVNVLIDQLPVRPTVAVVNTIPPKICGGAGSLLLNLTNVTDGTYAINYDGGSFNGVVVSNGTATISAKAGIYNNLQITYNTCTSTAGVNTSLADPFAPLAPIVGTITQPDCTIATGSVVLSGLPDAGTWTINPGGITGTGTSDTIKYLAAGKTYNFNVTNEADCSSIASADVEIIAQPLPPDIPVADVSVKPTCDKPTGTIEVTAPMGANYTYSIDGGVYQTSTVFASLIPESIHRIKVKDISTGCESLEKTITVDPVSANPPVPVATVTKVPTCNNLDGTIEFTEPTGTGFEYSIDGGANFQPLTIFTNQKTGHYILRVKVIITGCESDLGSIDVPAIPPPPTFTLAGVENCQCYNGNGSISFATDAVDGLYTIQYDNGQQFTNVKVTNGKTDKIPVPAGIYTNLIIDANGCTSDTISMVTVTQPKSIVIVPSITLIDLKSQTKGSINLAISGGSGPYPDQNIVWKADASIGFAGATGSLISNLNNGIYKVTVTDMNNCSRDTTIILPPPDYPPVAVNDDFTVSCNGVSGNLLLNDTDAEHEQLFLWLTLARNPSHGTITLNPDQSGAFEYVADPAFSGIDTFWYVITDTKQNMSNAALVTIHIVPDFDGDGIPDDIDQDADGDGILNVDEVLPGQDWKTTDSDGDGHPNWLDIDSDNDGIVDNIEAQSTKDYIPPTGIVNQYGVDYAYDPAHGGRKLIPVDTDGDGIPDFLDTDSDNDGVPDYIEGNDANHDGHPDFVVLSGKDDDGDGLDNVFDTVDKCASPATNMLGSNASLQDTDGDGIPDWRDDNDDGDKWPTRMEDWNGDGIWWNDDSNHNGIPDYLDPLSDCELFIPDAFSPNGDNIHDYFMIYCLQNYPNAKMYIFDQMGNKLYEKDHYGNLDVWKTVDQAWWDGRTTNRSVATSTGMVAPGTYFYVLQLGNGEVRKSYVFVSY